MKPGVNITKKSLCAHGPCGNAKHHVWYDNVTYVMWAAGTVLPLLFEVFMESTAVYVHTNGILHTRMRFVEFSCL